MLPILATVFRLGATPILPPPGAATGGWVAGPRPDGWVARPRPDGWLPGPKAS